MQFRRLRRHVRVGHVVVGLSFKSSKVSFGFGRLARTRVFHGPHLNGEMR